MAIQDQTLKNTYSGGVNAYGEKLGGFGATSAPIIPQNIPSINSSTLTPQPDLSSNLPQPSQPEAQGLNASVPSPQSLIQNAYQPTNTDSKQNDLLTRLATTIGGQQGLTTLTNQYEQQLGVQDLAKKANEASAQLEALNNQSLALQNQYNYTIPNQMQEYAFGRGITAGGLAPLQAGELRKNQIQQGAIASQALTAKSLYYAANNNLVLAKDSAEKAAKAQYEQQQIGIDALKAQLEAVKPQLDKEEKARSLTLEAQLNDRQKQLDYARKDKETILSWAAAATANGATPLQAQEITKANDLNSAFALYAPFAVDPMATKKAILELENQRLGIESKKADIALTYANIAKIKDASQALSVADAQKLGVPYGTTKEQAQSMGKVPGANQEANALKVNAKDSATELLRKLNAGEGTSQVGKSKIFSPFGAIPGTEAANFNIQFDNLKSLLSLDNVKYLKGQGQVSDAERRLLEQASAKLNRSQTEDEFKSTLESIIKNLSGTADPYADFRSQIQPGEILVNRGGQAVAITEDELKPTDIKL